MSQFNFRVSQRPCFSWGSLNCPLAFQRPEMVHRCRLTAEAELSLYLTAGGRESGLAMMFTDKIEDLLLPAGQGFHTVQENTLQRRRAGSNGVLEQWSGGELEYWNIGVLEYWFEMV